MTTLNSKKLFFALLFCATPLAGAQPLHVVFLGDSLTEGGPHLGDETETYPYMTAEKLRASYKTLGYPGGTTDLIKRQISEYLFAEHMPIRENILVVWGGTNDCAIGPVDCSYEAYKNLEYIAHVSRLAGWKVIAITMIARAGYFIDDEHQVRFPNNQAAFNDHLRTSVMFDGVADPSSQLADPYNTEYFWDRCHLLPSGYRIVADAVANAVRNLPIPAVGRRSISRP